MSQPLLSDREAWLRTYFGDSTEPVAALEALLENELPLARVEQWGEGDLAIILATVVAYAQEGSYAFLLDTLHRYLLLSTPELERLKTKLN